jgi:hypothetical protein
VFGDVGQRLDQLFDAGVVEREVEAPEGADRLVQRRLMSSERVTSHLTASTRPPDASIRRAVRSFSSSATSPTITLAPACANAMAVARPMPLAAPVMNATLPANPSSSALIEARLCTAHR